MQSRTGRLDIPLQDASHKEQCSVKPEEALAPAANHTPGTQPHASSNATPPPAACGLVHLSCQQGATPLSPGVCQVRNLHARLARLHRFLEQQHATRLETARACLVMATNTAYRVCISSATYAGEPRGYTGFGFETWQASGHVHFGFYNGGLAAWQNQTFASSPRAVGPSFSPGHFRLPRLLIIFQFDGLRTM